MVGGGLALALQEKEEEEVSQEQEASHVATPCGEVS